MARRESTSGNRSPRTRRPPATTPEARESQMISLATDLAERQLEDGTASSQVMSHYLKLGTTRERLEQEKIRYETELLIARKEAMGTASRMEELVEGALTAFRSYTGQPEPQELEIYDD